MKKTMSYMHDKKANGHKITMLTCYDYPTAILQEEAGIDVIFVGDSVGTNVLGYESETLVTLDEMVHHLKIVRRGVKNAYLLADMPKDTYNTLDDAQETAEKLLSLGADGVKFEGVKPDIVQHLVGQGIEVWTHIGYNPQHHGKAAVQGKSFDNAIPLIEGAMALQQAGASMLVLELVPEEVSELITKKLTIPTIGIAAGRYTDGQVLIVNDMLGYSTKQYRHSKRYMDFHSLALNAIRAYSDDVLNQKFPEDNHVRHMNDEELVKLRDWMKSK